MSTARKSIWTILATVAVVGTSLATSVIRSDAAEPVRASAPAPLAAEVEILEDLEDLVKVTTSTTTEPPTTTTTAAPSTTSTVPPTTAAPTTTAPPPPPPTTAAPPPPPPAPAAAPAPGTPQHGARNTNCEQFMYSQINGARANAGQGGLAFDGGIQYIAVNWSDHLAGTQNLAHNPNFGDQIVAHRDYRRAGENVGRGHDLGQLFQAFMDSPGHRENILRGDYSHVTVGCLTDAGGQLWVTQNFWG